MYLLSLVFYEGGLGILMALHVVEKGGEAVVFSACLLEAPSRPRQSGTSHLVARVDVFRTGNQSNYMMLWNISFWYYHCSPGKIDMHE